MAQGACFFQLGPFPGALQKTLDLQPDGRDMPREGAPPIGRGAGCRPLLRVNGSSQCH